MINRSVLKAVTQVATKQEEVPTPQLKLLQSIDKFIRNEKKANNFIYTKQLWDKTFGQNNPLNLYSKLAEELLANHSGQVFPQLIELLTTNQQLMQYVTHFAEIMIKNITLNPKNQTITLSISHLNSKPQLDFNATFSLEAYKNIHKLA